MTPESVYIALSIFFVINFSISLFLTFNKVDRDAFHYAINAIWEEFEKKENKKMDNIEAIAMAEFNRRRFTTFNEASFVDAVKAVILRLKQAEKKGGQSGK